MKNFILIFNILIIVLLGAIAIGTFQAKPTTSIFGDAGSPNYLGSTVTNTSSTCSGSTSTVILSAGKISRYALLTAIGSTSTYFCLSSSCPTGNGSVLSASSSYAINSLNMYVGAVSCIGAGSTSSVGIIYK